MSAAKFTDPNFAIFTKSMKSDLGGRPPIRGQGLGPDSSSTLKAREMTQRKASMSWKISPLESVMPNGGGGGASARRIDQKGNPPPAIDSVPASAAPDPAQSQAPWSRCVWSNCAPSRWHHDPSHSNSVVPRQIREHSQCKPMWQIPTECDGHKYEQHHRGWISMSGGTLKKCTHG